MIIIGLVLLEGRIGEWNTMFQYPLKGKKKIIIIIFLVEHSGTLEQIGTFWNGMFQKALL